MGIFSSFFNLNTTCAGFPATTVYAGTCDLTTDPAATTLPSPIFTPGKIMHRVPIHTPFPIITGRTSSSLGGSFNIRDAKSVRCPFESMMIVSAEITVSRPIEILFPTTNRHPCPHPELSPNSSTGLSEKRAPNKNAHFPSTLTPSPQIMSPFPSNQCK